MNKDMEYSEKVKIYQEKGELCLIGDDYYSRAIRLVRNDKTGMTDAYMKKNGEKEYKTAYSGSLVQDIEMDKASKVVSREEYDRY